MPSIFHRSGKALKEMDMKNLLEGIEDVLLLGPGPSCVPQEVYDALSRKTLGHLDPYFMRIMDATKEMLMQALNTGNAMTVPMSGTGSAGMEACFVNLVEPGDKVLILINGVFGVRMSDVAARLGADVDALEFTWGTPVVPDAVESKIHEKAYRIVAVVHAETSTGVRNPVAEIGRLLQGSDTLYLVDAVTSLGGIDVRMDDWGIDALYSGTQKCLSCPPGLAPLSFSERAVARLNARKAKVPNWYLDLSLIANYWGAKRVYHHTAPVNMIYGLYQALALLLEEGLEAAFTRHRKNHLALVRGLKDLGMEMLVEERWRLPMLNTVVIPAGVDELSVRKRLRSEYRIEIGAGLGPLAGKIWRIGLMGHSSREESVARLLAALKKLL
jgi:alanine-glyoxylate transaminase/serine-glyoxylate transaminase/serine-pyruvate transaminase